MNGEAIGVILPLNLSHRNSFFFSPFPYILILLCSLPQLMAAPGHLPWEPHHHSVDLLSVTWHTNSVKQPFQTAPGGLVWCSAHRLCAAPPVQPTTLLVCVLMPFPPDRVCGDLSSLPSKHSPVTHFLLNQVFSLQPFPSTCCFLPVFRPNACEDFSSALFQWHYNYPFVSLSYTLDWMLSEGTFWHSA